MRKIKPSTLKPDKEYPYSRNDQAVFHEHHDNRSQRIGDGSSGGQKIRIPSLKRSKKTWRNFYKLFPSMVGETYLRGKRIKLKRL